MGIIMHLDQITGGNPLKTINSDTEDGLVAASKGVANKVWKTDSNGIPGWREDGGGSGGGGTGGSANVPEYTLEQYEEIQDDIEDGTQFVIIDDFLDEEDASAIISDSKLSLSSSNPVQNKVITKALEGKADKGTTLAEYGIEDSYTKTEIDDLLGPLALALDLINRKSV